MMYHNYFHIHTIFVDLACLKTKASLVLPCSTKASQLCNIGCIIYMVILCNIDILPFIQTLYHIYLYIDTIFVDLAYLKREASIVFSSSTNATQLGEIEYTYLHGYIV